MAVLRRIPSDCQTNFDAEEISRLATDQDGVISRRQLLVAGVGNATVARWLKAGRLHRVHPHVYALGHMAVSLDGRLLAALLYGGDQAVLSHTTAAWLWNLIDAEPTRIHLTVPGRRSSLPGVRIHHSRRVERATCRHMPVTSVPRTLLDIAGMLPFRQLRRCLAEAEFRKVLRPTEVLEILGSGRRGSRGLRRALAHHLPELAETLSTLEERFLELCETAHLPIPEINSRIGRVRVDATWRDKHLAVELDGGDGHSGWRQIKRDRDREMQLREQGFQIVRYTWEQVTRRPDDVVADLRRLLDR